MLKIKALLSKVLGIFTGAEDIKMASGEPGIRAYRTDTDVKVGFIVGIGGINHGIYSYKLNKWMIYGDGSNTHFATKTGYIIFNDGVNNTTDTWIPVFRSGEIQHRVLPRNVINNMSVQYKSQALTVNANTATEATVDVASLVSGYQWAISYVNFSNNYLYTTNYWISGNTVHVVIRNPTASQRSGNIQVSVLRWKSET